MSRTADLAHIMADAQQKAALHYGMGEYESGDYWARVSAQAQDDLERIPDDSFVNECGVS
jgi:hypothetical protein